MVKDNPLLDGVTFSGGEPLEQAENFAVLGERIKEMGLNVITYTGYTCEKIIESFNDRPGWERLMKCTDILIDGPFEIDKKPYAEIQRFFKPKDYRHESFYTLRETYSYNSLTMLICMEYNVDESNLIYGKDKI